MNRTVTWGILGVGGVYLGALLMGAHVLMRRRQPDPEDLPTNYDMPFDVVEFFSRDGVKLHGWWIPASGDPSPDTSKTSRTIIVCHGQDGSKDGDTRQVAPLHKAGFNVLMFDFRAHGKSEGRQVTFGMYEKEDLMGAIDFLNGRGVEKVGVLGFSMGAATALLAAALTDRIACIVADSPFGKLKTIITRFLFNKGIPYYFARSLASSVLLTAEGRLEARMDQSSPVYWTPHIGPRPIFYIYGANDEFVPMSEAEQLITTSTGPVERWVLDNAGHRGTYETDPTQYNQRIIAFFDKYLP